MDPRTLRTASVAAIFWIAACGSNDTTSQGPDASGDDGSVGGDVFAGNDSGTDATTPEAGADSGVGDVATPDAADSGIPDAPPGDAGDGATRSPDGAADGATEAGADGAAEGAADSAADGAVHGGSDGAPEGASDASDSGQSGDADAAACVTVFAPGYDAGPVPDAGACPAGGASCAPAITSFSPGAWVPPTQAPACTSAQIQSFYADCWNGTSFSPCQTYLSGGANETCGACLFTSRAASARGPVVYETVALDAGVTQYFLAANYAGCVALEEPCNAACAAAIQADDSCQAAACNTAACASDTATGYSSCLGTANVCACYGYAQAADDCWGELAGASHPASSCLNLVDSVDAFTSVAKMFCWNGL